MNKQIHEGNSFEAEAIAKAEQIKEESGGTIFAFPTEEENPFSPFAVVMYMNGKYFTYPDAADISEASATVLVILSKFKECGLVADYKRNVRFRLSQAQMDKVWNQFKKDHITRLALTEGKYFTKGSKDTKVFVTDWGLLLLFNTMIVDEKNPEAFMEEYYKLLAAREYGKTPAEIKQEVLKMGRSEAFDWLNQTYEKYFYDDSEFIEILNKFEINKIQLSAN